MYSSNLLNADFYGLIAKVSTGHQIWHKKHRMPQASTLVIIN